MDAVGSLCSVGGVCAVCADCSKEACCQAGLVSSWMALSSCLRPVSYEACYGVLLMLQVQRACM
jgi:hypothetical protein